MSTEGKSRTCKVYSHPKSCACGSCSCAPAPAPAPARQYRSALSTESLHLKCRRFLSRSSSRTTRRISCFLRPGSPESCGQMQCHSHCLPWTRGGQSTQMGMHRDSGQLASTQRLRHSTQEILVNGQTSMWRTQTRMCPKLTTQLGMSFTRSMNGEAMLLSSTLAPLRRKQKWRH